MTRLPLCTDNRNWFKRTHADERVICSTSTSSDFFLIAPFLVPITCHRSCVVCHQFKLSPMGPRTKHTHLVFDVGLLVLVEVHLNQATAIQLDADALANNLSREADVLQHSIVHSRQRATARSQLTVHG